MQRILGSLKQGDQRLGVKVRPPRCPGRLRRDPPANCGRQQLRGPEPGPPDSAGAAARQRVEHRPVFPLKSPRRRPPAHAALQRRRRPVPPGPPTTAAAISTLTFCRVSRARKASSWTKTGHGLLAEERRPRRRAAVDGEHVARDRAAARSDGAGRARRRRCRHRCPGGGGERRLSLPGCPGAGRDCRAASWACAPSLARPH